MAFRLRRRRPAPPPAETHKGETVEINLVTVNDFHGRIEQSGTAAGIARLSTAVNQLRAEGADTIFAAAGDMIGASTFTSFIQQDVPTIEALNAAGLDVSSVGNHEFDRGFADLTDRVMPLAAWEYLGANVYDKATGRSRAAGVLDRQEVKAKKVQFDRLRRRCHR